MQFGSPSKTWTIIGQLAVVVTIVVGFIELWKFLRPAEQAAAKLVATASYFEFQLPPDLLDQFESLRKLGDSDVAAQFLKTAPSHPYDSLLLTFSSVVDHYVDAIADPAKEHGFDAFKKSLAKDNTAANKLVDAFHDASSRLLTNYARSGWSNDYRYSAPAYKGYLIITTSNDGSRAATNVELALPYEGMGLIETTGTLPQPTRINRRIVLGTILPARSTTVRVWTTYSKPNRWDRDQWHLSYADGVGTVRFAGSD